MDSKGSRGRRVEFHDGLLLRFGRQRDAAGHQHAWELSHPGQGHHHRGQTLVARGNSHHPAAPRERPDQPPKHDGGVVAVGQAVHHPGSALRAAIAWVGAEAREGQAAKTFDFPGGGLHEQTDFPVTGVIAQGDRFAVIGAESAGGAEDEEFLATQLSGIPAHAGVLREAEQIAAGPVEEHLLGKRQRASGAGCAGADLVDFGR